MPGTPFDNLINTSADALGFSSENIEAPRPGGSVIIEELGIASPRRITLKSRAMPYQGVAWEGEQGVKTTWYSGNPVASVQVLGPRELPTTMEGMWKDRFLPGSILVEDIGGVGGVGGNGSTSLEVLNEGIKLAEDAAQFFHKIRRAGTALRVQWLSETRFGILRHFSAEYDRAQDIRWSAEFEWYAWDDDESLRTAEEPIASSSLLDTYNLIVNAIALAPDIARAVQATLVDLVNDIGDSIGELFSILETFDSILDTPGAILGAMLNTSRELGRELTELMRKLMDVRWPNTVSAPAMGGPSMSPVHSSKTQSSVVKQELEFDRWRRTVGKIAGKLRTNSDAAVHQRIERISPKTTRSTVILAGMTLYDVSRKYYGSPDFASYIARANGASSARLVPGTTIRIPPRPTGPISRSIGVTGRSGSVAGGPRKDAAGGGDCGGCC